MSCAVVALLAVGGCAGTEDTIGQVLVAPGYYEFYNCQQLAAAAKPLRVRLQELDELMAKSSKALEAPARAAVVVEPPATPAAAPAPQPETPPPAAVETATAKNCDEREMAGQPAKPAVQKPPSDLTNPVR